MKNRLEELRKKKQTTYVALMAQAHVSPVTLQKIEKFDHVPRSEVRERIASALGVEVSSIWPEAAQGTAAN